MIASQGLRSDLCETPARRTFGAGKTMPNLSQCRASSDALRLIKSCQTFTARSGAGGVGHVGPRASASGATF